MARNETFGMSSVIEGYCIECKTPLVIYRRWVQGDTKEPALCPKCRKPCQKKDDGKRKDSNTGNEYIRYTRIEVTFATLKKSGETVPSDFNVPPNE
jgi:hypothetical protein